MKNQNWSVIHEIFEELDNLQSKAQGVISLRGKSPGGMQVLRKGIQEDNLIPLRAEIRNKLDYLKAKLGESLTDREVYLVLFPIVVYFDEIVQLKIAQGQPLSWPPLQKELYQISNGGEAFFDALDDILRKPETIPFVYEVFYFCLNDGFQGKYAENPIKIDEYKSKLCTKIPISPINAGDNPSEPPNLMRSSRFPIWYYLAASVLAAGVYTLLYMSI